MQVIIHAGMHKTGSSSIQRTFSTLDSTDLHYLDWRSANHSAMIPLLFHDRPERYHGFKSKGRAREHLLEERAFWMNRLVEQMQSGEHERVLLSAEYLSGREDDTTTAIADFFRNHSSDIRVIAYVRPPISFMQSAFQQRVRFGRVEALQVERLWPRYKDRFEKFDRLFGRDAVTLRKYSPECLEGGDVVLDLASQIGVSIPPEATVRANVSTSLEAIALIFAQRRLGGGVERGFAGAPKKNSRFAEAISRIGTQKLAFAPSLTEPVVQAFRGDVEWMEERLGQPLLDDPPSTGRQIASEEDLLAVAEENRDALEEILIEMIRRDEPEPHGRLVRNLNLLRKLYS